MNPELLQKGIDYATIVTWILVIGGFFLLRLSNYADKSKSSRHASKK